VFFDVTTGLQFILHQLIVQQATDAGMIVNGRKTKEMLIGPALKDPPPSVSLSGTPMDRVTVFKLLGVHVASGRNMSTPSHRRQPRDFTSLSS